MKKSISPRGTSVCRACNKQNLISVLDLGLQPLPSEYGSTRHEVLEKFPLHLRICTKCGLGQVGEYVLPQRIFHDTYPYLSSASSTWIEHSKIYAQLMKDQLNLNRGSLVVELASNDGYLLSEFLELGMKVIGVEPAPNVAKIAKDVGITTIVDFFGSEVAQYLVRDHGYPRLIVANNVYAHIPDMQDFTKGLSILAGIETVITIENPSFARLLQNALFDTIYHEHYSYLSAHSVQAIAQLHGLELFHVDKLSTHGGSNRYYLGRKRTADSSVALELEEEVSLGLFDKKRWLDFAERSLSAIDGLREWFIDRQNEGSVVVGYGAAHKGNSFLNAVGETARTLLYVVDASSEKQGKFLPGTQVPVIEPQKLNSANPTDILILPWNLAAELSERAKALVPQARIWIAQPKMTLLS